MLLDELDDFAIIAFEVQVVALHAHVVARVRYLAALAADLAVLCFPIAVIGQSLARLEVEGAVFAVLHVPHAAVGELYVEHFA